MKAQSDHTVESSPEFYELAAVSMDSPAENITKGIMHQLQSVGFLLLTNVSGFNEKELF